MVALWGPMLSVYPFIGHHLSRGLAGGGKEAKEEEENVAVVVRETTSTRRRRKRRDGEKRAVMVSVDYIEVSRKMLMG